MSRNALAAILGICLFLIAAGLLCVAQTNAPSRPARRVITVSARFVERARDEATLAQLLNSDVEDSAIGRGVFDYAKRIRILRLMDKLRREYADEAQQMK